MMDKLGFQVGKKYRYTDATKIPDGIVFDSSYNSFICMSIDRDGDAYTEDCSHDGKRGSEIQYGCFGETTGWCVAAKRKLLNGIVIEVTE